MFLVEGGLPFSGHCPCLSLFEHVKHCEFEQVANGCKWSLAAKIGQMKIKNLRWMQKGFILLISVLIGGHVNLALTSS